MKITLNLFFLINKATVLVNFWTTKETIQIIAYLRTLERNETFKKIEGVITKTIIQSRTIKFFENCPRKDSNSIYPLIR